MKIKNRADGSLLRLAVRPSENHQDRSLDPILGNDSKFFGFKKPPRGKVELFTNVPQFFTVTDHSIHLNIEKQGDCSSTRLAVRPSEDNDDQRSICNLSTNSKLLSCELKIEVQDQLITLRDFAFAEITSKEGGLYLKSHGQGCSISSIGSDAVVQQSLCPARIQ